jgi:membrane-bound metal-dependent hydrolase YbcI (DUF457 family)
MSGWIAANFFTLSPRERFLCMLAASAPDIDGAGLLISWDLYQKTHHALGHNIFFGIIAALIFAFCSERKQKMFWLCLGLFNLHVIMDLLGSGELWTISYFWPLSGYELSFEHGWPFYSWQNISAGTLCLAATAAIIYWRKRSPLEFIMPSLDRKIVSFFKADRGKAE